MGIHVSLISVRYSIISGNTPTMNRVPNIVYGSKMTILADNKERFSPLKGPNNEVYLQANEEISNLSLEGKLSMSDLRPKDSYKGTFVLEITNPLEEGSTFDVTIELSDHQINVKREHKINSTEIKPGNDLKLETNPFEAPSRGGGDLTFKLNQTDSHPLKGLILKSFFIMKA